MFDSDMIWAENSLLKAEVMIKLGIYKQSPDEIQEKTQEQAGVDQQQWSPAQEGTPPKNHRGIFIYDPRRGNFQGTERKTKGNAGWRRILSHFR